MHAHRCAHARRLRPHVGGSVMSLTRRLPQHGIGFAVRKRGEPEGVAWTIRRVVPSTVRPPPARRMRARVEEPRGAFIGWRAARSSPRPLTDGAFGFARARRCTKQDGVSGTAYVERRRPDGAGPSPSTDGGAWRRLRGVRHPQWSLAGTEVPDESKALVRGAVEWTARKEDRMGAISALEGSSTP